MLNQSVYSQCRNLVNQPVEIRCNDGSVHRGVLTRVDERNAYLQPAGSDMSNNPGLFLWGGWGWGYPIALASIAAILALGFLW
ncbi:MULTISPECIES: hypothetical protein [Sporolactobacillus]|uniref:LSM domain-containing protein n=1 Tax=Sporolactobacillus nakayamae TaxID=269670 RepID=A0A1I2N6F4_9BACL|nr:hypothetical protein [Sporolactobacillus nakayamae]SFF98429.1 hypothetical protein SAMN02982927_00272 [Sporolactobacillus nakayamae]